jgi:hypothetical protein
MFSNKEFMNIEETLDSPPATNSYAGSQAQKSDRPTNGSYRRDNALLWGKEQS